MESTDKAKVLALTSGKSTPSARFRVRQLIVPLSNCGIEISEDYRRIRPFLRRFFLGRQLDSAVELMRRRNVLRQCHSYDAVVIQKPLINQFLSYERTIRKPLIFDVDDAVHLKARNGGAAARIASIADAVVVGNETLRSYYSSLAHNVKVIPTAVDANRYRPAPRAHEDGGVLRLGWIGTAGNLEHLERLDEVLSSIFSKFGDVKLLVVSNRRPAFDKVPASKVHFVEWSPTVEIEAIQMMDIGLMPLRDGPWERGKCAFKMLQYMSCGIPVVVSPVGMNADVLDEGDVGIGASTDEQWLDALAQLLRDQPLRREMGRVGRELVLRRYSLDAIVRRWEELILEVIG